MRRFIILGVPIMGAKKVAAPIAAGPPMSNAWSRSGAWAAPALQIRFIPRPRKNHPGTNTDVSAKKFKNKNSTNGTRIESRKL